MYVAVLKLNRMISLWVKKPLEEAKKRLKKYTKRRTRFVAREPHDIWQTDAKGPVS